MLLLDQVEVVLWPFPNVFKSLGLNQFKPKEEREREAVVPFLDLTGHMMVIAGSVRAWIVAYMVVYLSSTSTYPAFGAASSLSSDWIVPILVRNLLGTWLMCGFWDWFLYFSPMKSVLHPLKLNPVYPPVSQFIHDAMYTTGATIIASLFEISYCYAVCSGLLPVVVESNLTSWDNLLWIAGTAHIRQPHFYAIHRMMHPWRWDRDSYLGKYCPDVGKYLYRQVHSVHHKSHNPTAFSGTSMHPVEATLYYSCCLFPIMLGRHPTIVLAWLVDCAMGAWLGHDGFQMPIGQGDDFHQLHHEHCDCNYGTAIDGIDYMMGSFVSTISEFGERRKKKSKNE